MLQDWAAFFFVVVASPLFVHSTTFQREFKPAQKLLNGVAASLCLLNSAKIHID